MARQFPGEHDQTFIATRSAMRQGDVLELLPADADPEEWSAHFGVLVTGDCDLVHTKSGGIVTYVPVVPAAVYARAFILPSMFGEQRARSWRLVDDALQRHGLPVTRDRLHEMIALGETASAVASLLCQDHDVAGKVARVVEGVIASAEAEQYITGAQSPDEAWGRLVTLRSLLNSVEKVKPKKAVMDTVRKELSGRLQKLPDDAMFLGSIGPTYDGGYVAYVRLLRELDKDQIALGPADERFGGNPDKLFAARRVSRLRLIYTHKLLQKMAAVFTDIGLPAEYEASRDSIVAGCAAQWVPPINGAGKPKSNQEPA